MLGDASTECPPTADVLRTGIGKVIFPRTGSGDTTATAGTAGTSASRTSVEEGVEKANERCKKRFTQIDDSDEEWANEVDADAVAEAEERKAKREATGGAGTAVSTSVSGHKRKPARVANSKVTKYRGLIGNAQRAILQETATHNNAIIKAKEATHHFHKVIAEVCKVKYDVDHVSVAWMRDFKKSYKATDDQMRALMVHFTDYVEAKLLIVNSSAELVLQKARKAEAQAQLDALIDDDASKVSSDNF